MLNKQECIKNFKEKYNLDYVNEGYNQKFKGFNEEVQMPSEICFRRYNNKFYLNHMFIQLDLELLKLCINYMTILEFEWDEE